MQRNGGRAACGWFLQDWNCVFLQSPASGLAAEPQICLSTKWTAALQLCQNWSLPVNVQLWAELGELGNGQFGFVRAAMGSGTSRGKKVAPACVDQVTSIKTSSKPLKRPLQAPKIHAILRNARSNCAPPDRHSEGRDSDSSGEDDDGQRDEVPERRGWVSARKVTARKSTKTYGLCHSRRDGEEDSGPEEPPALRGANRRRNEAFPKRQLQVSSS